MASGSGIELGTSSRLHSNLPGVVGEVANSVVSPRMKIRLAYRTRVLRQGLSRHLLALPSFGWWLAFFVAPLAVLVLFSFGKINIITFKISFGWTVDNYVNIADSLYLQSIGRSLALSAAVTAGCLLIGFPVALYISKQSPRVQRLLLTAIIIPFWTSFLIRTYAWLDLLSEQGPLADVLRTLGLIRGDLNILFSSTAVGIGILYTYLPLMILPLYVALERIDPRLHEAASDLGAGSRRVLRRVTIPLAAPGIVAGCLLVGIPATGEYVVPAILGGGKTLMFGNVLADQFTIVGDYPFGSALAASFMAIMTIFLVLARRRLAELEARTV
jgi:spermidine/putrescine transport system permease protein